MKNGRPAAPRALQAQFWEGIRLGSGIAEAGGAAGVGPVKAFEWLSRRAG